MTKAGERLLEGAREAVALARGEVPAARMLIRGHAYVPESAALDAVLDAVLAERERCALLAEAVAGEKATEARDAGRADHQSVLSSQRWTATRIANAIRKAAPSSGSGR